MVSRSITPGRLPYPSIEQYDWQLNARCRGFPVSIFYPHTSGHRQRVYAAELEAKSVCARCIVVRNCLAHAIAADEPAGVWGGLNRNERMAHSSHDR